MNQTPGSAARFFVVINGQAQGPHTPGMVLNLWQQGAINGDTLACQEGAQNWTRLQDLEPVLRAATAAPPPPAGYAAPLPVPQVIVVPGGDTTKGLRLGALIGALVLFFLPWIEFQCAGQRLVYQSGLQAALNKASVDDGMKQMAEMGGTSGGAEGMPKVDDKEMEKVGHSWLTVGAMAAVVLALAVGAGRGGRRASGALAAVALACLGAQAVMGFPFKTAIERDMKDKPAAKAPAGGTGSPDFPMPDFEKEMGGMVGVRYTPWFYG
jgi:hypothetical protein